jgi:hypothetical protein
MMYIHNDILAALIGRLAAKKPPRLFILAF